MANSDLCGLGAIALHELKNVDCLEHEIRRLNGEIANLEGEFEHDISIFGQLTKRKAELERNVSSLSELSTLEHIKLKQVIFDSRQNNIVGKFMARMDEYANISGSVHEEQFKLLESYRELEALVTEVLSLPISDAKFRLRSMQEEVASKKTEVLVSNESMHSIELKMRDKISVIQNLRGLNSEKRVRLSDEVNCCNNLRAILLKTSEDLNSAIQMIEEDKEKNASSWQNLVCEVDQLRSDIVVLKDSVSFIAKLHTETREEYERVLNELELLPPNIQQKSALVDHAKEKIREIHAKTSNSVRSIEENKAEIARLHEDISKSKEARSSGVSPIAQVQEQRDELTRSICYLNDRLSKLKTEISGVLKNASSIEATAKAAIEEIIATYNSAENDMKTLKLQSGAFTSEINHYNNEKVEIRSQIDQNAIILNEIHSNLAAQKINLAEVESKKSIQNQTKKNDIEKLLQVQISAKNELARLEKEISSYKLSPDQKLMSDRQQQEIEKYKAECKEKQLLVLSKLREEWLAIESKFQSNVNIKLSELGREKARPSSIGAKLRR